jgi:signal transduction histidine kinase
MDAEHRSGPDLYPWWLALALVSTAGMWVQPGDETIPYHIGWAGFGLMYGLGRAWSPRRTALALGLFTGVTGGILVARASAGVLAWQETAEIPLMLLLVALMVWHVRRRQLALAAATHLARRDAQRAHDHERLTRLTSHELRTPLTIARGFVELLRSTETRAERIVDLDVVDDELQRLSRVCERLVRVIQAQTEPELHRFDVDELLRQTGERWAIVSARRWVVQAEAGEVECSAERLRAVLDTLVENAVRYTREGDTVRIFARRKDGCVELGVADSGPGMSARQMALLNRGTAPTEAVPDTLPRDALSQTGLGLGLVRTVVAARDGRLLARTAPEGGAEVAVYLPLGTSPAIATASQLALNGTLRRVMRDATARPATS